jgi:hypothetical protein
MASEKLLKLESWRVNLRLIAESMAASNEKVLSEHIESVIDDLNFQIDDLLSGGAIVINLRKTDIQNFQDAKKIVEDLTKKLGE